MLFGSCTATILFYKFEKFLVILVFATRNYTKKIKSWPHLPSPCVLLGLCLQPRVSNRYSNSPLSGFFWVSQVNTLIQILCCYFITIIRAFLVFSICLLMFYLKVEGKMILYLYCFLNQKQKQLQSSGKPKYYN